MSERMHVIRDATLKCPDCVETVDVVRDDKDRPGILHPMPTCKLWDKTDNPVDFLRIARERREGLS
jgi:hypothetical protein